MAIRNYILYVPDSMRAESIGCYGNELVKTPNFDKLAAAGVSFHNCMHKTQPVPRLGVHL
jgi:choline-sulfatase